MRDRRIGHMLTAITFTIVKPIRNSMDPKLLNQSINALTKPGYMRYVYTAGALITLPAR
jgi:hypothetical protein